MEKRELGNSGIKIAPLAFGANVFGWTVDEPAGFMLLDAFVDAGFDLKDAVRPSRTSSIIPRKKGVTRC